MLTALLWEAATPANAAWRPLCATPAPGQPIPAAEARPIPRAAPVTATTSPRTDRRSAMAAPGYSFGWPRAGEGGAGPSLDPRLVFVMARSDSPRVGLVLGAGGVIGGARINGGLAALAAGARRGPAGAR